MLDQIVAVKKYIDTLSIVKTHTARIIKSSLEAPELQRAKKEIRVRYLRFAQVEKSKAPANLQRSLKLSKTRMSVNMHQPGKRREGCMCVCASGK